MWVLSRYTVESLTITLFGMGIRLTSGQVKTYIDIKNPSSTNSSILKDGWIIILQLINRIQSLRYNPASRIVILFNYRSNIPTILPIILVFLINKHNFLF